MIWALLLLLYPRHRPFARLVLGEWLIGQTLRVLPPGPEQQEFAHFAISCWMGRNRER